AELRGGACYRSQIHRRRGDASDRRVLVLDDEIRMPPVGFELLRAPYVRVVDVGHLLVLLGVAADGVPQREVDRGHEAAPAGAVSFGARLRSFGMTCSPNRRSERLAWSWVMPPKKK